MSPSYQAGEWMQNASKAYSVQLFLVMMCMYRRAASSGRLLENKTSNHIDEMFGPEPLGSGLFPFMLPNLN